MGKRNIPLRKRLTSRNRTPGIAALAIGIVAAWTALAMASVYEKPRTFKVEELLKPYQVKGAHFEVAAEVPTEGYLHIFSIATDYGPLEAEGTSMLLVRLHEVEAIAQLDKVSESEVFLKAAGTSVVNVGKGILSTVKNPVGTVKGVFGGLKRFGTNLGRKAKRASAKIAGSSKKNEDEDKSAKKGSSDPIGGAAKSILGVNSAMRRWARKVGVDPYTTNPILRKALENVATADAAGSILTKIVVPVPAIASYTAQVGDLVWGKDPEELRKHNEKLLKEMGVSGDAIKELYLSKGFTLTLQTRLAGALSTVKAKGSADYVETATEADTNREGIFFAESAEMLRRLHSESPVAALLSDSRTIVAKTKNGRAVALLPVDWICWTESFDKMATEWAGRAKKELGAKRLEMRLSGRMSAKAKTELMSRGWRIVENASLLMDI